MTNRAICYSTKSVGERKKKKELRFVKTAPFSAVEYKLHFANRKNKELRAFLSSSLGSMAVNAHVFLFLARTSQLYNNKNAYPSVKQS